MTGLTSRTAGAVTMLVAALTATSGCDQAQRALLIHAPNYESSILESEDESPRALKFWGASEQFRVKCGPPEASILVWVFEPGEDAAKAGRLVDGKPRGTVLALYGYRNSMHNMRGIGEQFAEAGYRAVMMDLRGHGRSTGDYITYGVLESRDVRQVIAALAERGLIEGKLGLWGISMGGSTALMAAADEPHVATVVTVAAFTTMRKAVPHFARRMGIVPFEDDEEIQRFIDESAAEAQFNPDEADTLAAIRRMRVPVLVMHGAGDEWVPAGHGHELWAAAPAGSRLLVLPFVGHLDAHFDFGGDIERASVAWFDEHLGAAAPAAASSAQSVNP